MKKLTILVLSLAFVLGLCSCGQQEPLEQIPFFAKTCSAEEVIEKINSIGEVTLEKEQLLEEIYVDYSQMPKAEKAKVTNYDVLDDARNAIAKLYNTEEKAGERIDRSKILRGVYCVYTWNDERIQWVADAGIDFIHCVPNNTGPLDLCSKYGLGAFLSYLPGWFGGDGSNAGGYASAVPSGTFDSYAANFVDHPAIWAVDMGDEPNCIEFPHYGTMIKEAEALFPGKLAYLNIYPNYASLEQQGVPTYEEYIDIYCQNIDTDYICYDGYPIIEWGEDVIPDHDMFMHIDNVRVVSNACKKYGKDFWYVLQCGAQVKLPLTDHKYMTVEELNSQVYPALAYGAKVLTWACWEDGWFVANSNMIDRSGNRTPAYYRVKEVNENIDALSPVYMKYTNIDTSFIGDIATLEAKAENLDLDQGENGDNYNVLAEDDNVLNQDFFKNISVNTSDATLAGYFEKNSGEGHALLVTNVEDFFAYEDNYYVVSTISFELENTDCNVIAYYPDYACNLTPDENSVYSFDLARNEGVFVTVEYTTAK